MRQMKQGLDPRGHPGAGQSKAETRPRWGQASARSISEKLLAMGVTSTGAPS